MQLQRRVLVKVVNFKLGHNTIEIPLLNILSPILVYILSCCLLVPPLSPIKV